MPGETAVDQQIVAGDDGCAGRVQEAHGLSDCVQRFVSGRWI